MKKVFFIVLMFCAVISAQDQQQTGNRFESNLLSQGGISVTIGGNFIVTGSFAAGMNERLDQFITRLYTPAREKLLASAGSDKLKTEKIYQDLERYSFRNIILKRADGSETKIDLMKFRLTGNFKNNPYLKNDDVIIFQPIDYETQFFSVSGAVNSPGRFPFVEGDNLKDAIELSGGLNKNFDIKGAEIVRLNYDGTSMETVPVDINGSALLHPGDRIQIKASENLRKEYSVKVLGEVNSPGSIPITKSNTTLKEVIDMAGGFKDDASLSKARIFTGSSIHSIISQEYNLKLQDQNSTIENNLTDNLIKIEDMLMTRMSNATVDDTAYLYLENRLRVLTEGGSLDFTKLNEPGSETSKYLVKDGDVIIIPQKSTTVYVFGQVPEPGHISYIQGKDYKYYINRAGGLGEYALGKDVMVIKGSTRKWVEADDKNTTVEEGDYIFVPREISKGFNQYVGQIGAYFSIIGSIATVVLLVVQFTK